MADNRLSWIRSGNPNGQKRWAEEVKNGSKIFHGGIIQDQFNVSRAAFHWGFREATDQNKPEIIMEYIL